MGQKLRNAEGGNKFATANGASWAAATRPPPRLRRGRHRSHNPRGEGERAGCDRINPRCGQPDRLMRNAFAFRLSVIGAREGASYPLSVSSEEAGSTERGARSWRSPGFYFIPSGLRLFHQLARLSTNNPPQRYIDHFRVGEDFGHVRLQNDYVGPLPIAPHILTTLALREIVFVSHLFT